MTKRRPHTNLNHYELLYLAPLTFHSRGLALFNLVMKLKFLLGLFLLTERS